MAQLSVSVIIPSYNTEGLLRKNLPKVIKAFKNEKNKIVEVILVDDASPDNSVKVIKKEFPHINSVLDTTDHAGGANPYYQPEK